MSTIAPDAVGGTSGAAWETLALSDVEGTGVGVGEPDSEVVDVDDIATLPPAVALAKEVKLTKLDDAVEDSDGETGPLPLALPCGLGTALLEPVHDTLDVLVPVREPDTVGE